MSNEPRIGDAFGEMLRECHAANAAPWFNYLFLSLEELTQIATTAGWRVVDQAVSRPSYMVTLSRG